MATFQDKPLAADILSNSQGDIQGNFEFLQTVLNKDHLIGFVSDATQFEGRHVQVSLKDRGNNNLAMPGDGTDSLIWDSGGNIYWKNTTVSAGIQMTNSNVGSPSAIANGGFSFLPGGIMICWGSVTTNVSPTTVTFPNMGFSTVFQVYLTGNNTNSLPVLNAPPTNTNFAVAFNNPGNNPTIRWFAIGAK